MIIYTASTCRATRWTRKNITWAKLVERLGQCLRTPETWKEYRTMTKEQQGRTKDVGGFVGGELRNGARKKAFVLNRTLLTIDIDKGLPDEQMWERITNSLHCALVVYSTHSHSPETPRYRLVAPLDREVSTEEYVAISRRVAEWIGMDMIDHTTHQVERMFYWPSAAEDGAWFFREQEGEPLHVFGILETYTDYTDISQYPLHPCEKQAPSNALQYTEDPREKGGLIGAFCSVYSIEEALQIFLTDVYEPCGKHRYTYKGGNTRGGMQTYDNLFAYSYHDHDPIADGHAYNAFDLVRIHKFGSRDKEANYADASNAPSMRAMIDFVKSDERVTRYMAENDFGSLQDIDDADIPKFDVDKRGKIANTPNNYLLILTETEAFRGALRANRFTGFIDITRPLPWRTAQENNRWRNSDYSQLRMYIAKNYEGIYSRTYVEDAVIEAAERNAYHPIRDYLCSLENKWDGTPRLDTLFVRYLGAPDDKLNRLMTRKHFVAAVSRVFEPGCKYDYCLILVGKQGIGKSTVISIMAGEWFSDSVFTMEGKQGMETLRMAWIVELGELAQIRRSESEQVKSFISRRDDMYRAAYARDSESHPRQCVFFGTTNDRHFLKDPTGNRRFWVIPCKAAEPCSFDALRAERDQLWAEAVMRYKEGELLYLDSDLEKALLAQQAPYDDLEDDPTIDKLKQWLGALRPEGWGEWDRSRRQQYFLHPDPLQARGRIRVTRMCAAEFLFEMLNLDRSPLNNYRYEARKVNRFMEHTGIWESAFIVSAEYGRQKGWRLKATHLVDAMNMEDDL